MKNNNDLLLFDLNIHSEKSDLVSEISNARVLSKIRNNIMIEKYKHKYTFDYISLNFSTTNLNTNNLEIIYNNNEFIIYKKNNNDFVISKNGTTIQNIKGEINWIKSIDENMLLLNSFRNGVPEYHIFNSYTCKFSKIKIKDFSINFLKFNKVINKFVLYIENYYSSSELRYYNNINEINNIFSEDLTVEHLIYNDKTFIHYNKITRKDILPDENSVIIYLHGGPHSTDLNIQNPIIKEFLLQNYTVYSLNYYGSSLFGTQYLEKINGDWFNYEVEQISIFIREIIGSQEEKFVLVGESYGSILSVILSKRFIDRISAIVTVSPIFNLQRLLSFRNLYKQNISMSKVERYNDGLRYLSNNFHGRLLMIYGEKDKFITSSDINKFLHQFSRTHNKNKNIYLKSNKNSGHYFYTDDDIDFIVNKMDF